MLPRTLLLGSLAILLSACGGAGDPASQAEDLTQSVLKEGSAEALAVLAVANDRSLSVSGLKAAGLDSRAAGGIVAHRDGPDGTPRTADDDLFDDVAELDAVKWVGAASLKKLLAYADAHGYLAKQKAKERDVIFSPQPIAQAHTARIAELIDGAQTSIDVAMYSFSDANIQKALSAAVARGVKVRFLFDTAAEDRKLTGSALEASKSGQLEKIGVDVRWVNKILHHKFVIVDGPRDDAEAAWTARIASGSGNWSNGAATKYDENTLFLTGYAELALRLQREFDLLWEHSNDLVVASIPFEASTLDITDDLLPEEPQSHVLFTSTNFKVKNTTFSSLGTNEIADAWVAAILGAEKSIHIASGHLRSRPIAEALMEKAKDPAVEIRVYLDGQEYISQAGHADQVAELESCLEKAGTSASQKRACIDKGFLFGYQVGKSGVDVRYKYYAYRWDVSYAKQMHHKLMIVDGTDLYTGSYNLSDNAEHATFENMFVFKGPEFAELVARYEENFAKLWETGRAEDRLGKLEATIQTAQTIPIVFDPMSLTWDEITSLKALIKKSCPAVDSQEFRENAAAHLTCTK